MVEARFRNMWTFLMEISHEELGDISRDMRCIICAGILINAHSASCGCRYCLACIKAYLNGERRLCPGNMDDCQRETLDMRRNIHADHAINYRISKLIIKCRNSCGFRCELRKMEEHERACGRQPASCPYVNAGCTETQLVSDGINEHLVGESGAHASLLMACIDRLQGELSAMKRDAAALASETTNLRKENRLVREQNHSLRTAAERHRTHSPGLILSIICCCVLAAAQARLWSEVRDIAWRGPLEKEELRGLIDLVRGEMEAGLSDQEQRVRQMGAGLSDQEQRVRQMGRTVEMRNQKTFVWRIDGWAAKNQSLINGTVNVIFSDAFYSHENGYRMCLSVWPGEYYGDGEGVQLDIFFHLMRGPFDSILPWPFQRTVMLSVIEHGTGIDHMSDIIAFNDLPDDAGWNRPTTDFNGGLGRGQLPALSSEEADPGLQDTIFIKCVVW